MCITKSGSILFLTFLLQINPASAHFFDGNYFFKTCKSSRDSFQRNFGMGIVAGVVDVELNKDIGRTLFPDAIQFKALFCLRPNVNIGQLYDIACKFSTENPSHRDSAAIANIQNAFIEEFPCRKTR
jgi:hypothetical protein